MRYGKLKFVVAACALALCGNMPAFGADDVRYGGHKYDVSSPTVDGTNIYIDFKATSEDFPNPERGFYRATGEYFDNLGPEIANIRWAAGDSERVRLILAVGDLRAYRYRDISSEYLMNIQRGFDILRDAGVKAVIFFTYSRSDGETDTDKYWMIRHINQLAPVLQKNEDVIAVIQAGFIGTWAEWFNTKLDINDKKEILDLLLEKFPHSRQIEVRRPRDLMKIMQENVPTEKDLLLSSPPSRARIGLHNNCFLASKDDYGTYWGETAAEAESIRSFAKDLTDWTSFGGETCRPDYGNGPRMSCSDILKEGAEYHLTYLSKTWSPDFVDGWKAQGCFDEVSKKMGYRLRLDQVQLQIPATDEERISWEIELTNEGWARPMNSRSLVLRFWDENTDTTVNHVLYDTDLRLVGPGERTVMSGTLRLPPELRPGEYKILLGAPDPDSSLKRDPRYSIRFANRDQPEKNQRWLADEGFMDLGARIVVE